MVHKWVTDVRCNAFKGIAKVCRGSGLEDEDMTQCTREVSGQSWDQGLEDLEARTVFSTKIMWKSTDFLRHVKGETEGRGVIAFIYVCQHWKVFPVEDVLWWLPTNNGGKRK